MTRKLLNFRLPSFRYYENIYSVKIKLVELGGKEKKKKKGVYVIIALFYRLIENLIPWPGPQIISVARTFFDPLTIEIQSSPSLKKKKKQELRKVVIG